MAQAMLKTATGGALGDYPSFGLSMRFSVEVDDGDIKDLGLWQSCKGLSVELQYKKIEQGGMYTQAYLLPDKLSFGKIKLERAVSQKDSSAVQAWLVKYITNWQIYPNSASNNTSLSTNLIITLLDYQLAPVMAWTLYQARPTRWDGPSLGASDNKVAIETLEFEHEGFLFPPDGE
jgi:phage tail-like protein